MSGFDESTVSELLRGHDGRMRERRTKWRMYRASYNTEFWTQENVWTHPSSNRLLANATGSGIPIKVEVNMIRPLVNAMLTPLFFRKPRSLARPPAWMPTKPGRPKNFTAEEIDAVSAVGSEFLARTDIQTLATHAYELAIMYGAPAYKVCMDDRKKGEIPERLTTEVIEPWNLVLDERDTTGRPRYIGHVRYESTDFIMERFPGAPIKEGGQFSPTHIPDFLEDGNNDVPEDSDKPNDESYLRLLEFYDFTTSRVTWWLVTPGDVGAQTLVRLADEEMPYADASGNGVAPIVPVVLQNVPEFPLKALAIVDATYELNAERNLLMSILASAMRRDAGRMMLFLRQFLDEEAIAAIERGDDMAFIGIDGNRLDGIFQAVDLPRFGQSLDKYKSWLSEGSQEVRGVSDLAGGRSASRGLTPVSSQEIQALTDSDQQSTGRVAKRMNDSLSKLQTLMLLVLSTELKDAKQTQLRMREGTDTLTVKTDTLREHWEFTIMDSASTPGLEQQRRAELLGIVDKYFELVAAAAEAPEGSPAQRAASLMVDRIVDLWNLPDNFSWTFLSAGEEVPPEAPEAAPGGPPAPAPGEPPLIPPGKEEAFQDALVDVKAERAAGLVPGGQPV